MRWQKLGRNLRSLAITVSITPLAACFSHSSSEVVTALPDQLQSTASVSEVRIVSVPPDAPLDFQAGLLSTLKKSTSICATGPHKLRLEATVTRFRGQNVGMTMLVGSSTVIEGTAKLVEPATGTVVGDYDIAQSTGGGGVFAAIGMSGADWKMQEAFASDVCKKAFGRAPYSSHEPPPRPE